MKKRFRNTMRVLSLLIALSCLGAVNPANAASFDCAKATSSDEKAICSNANLSSLDSEMAGLWYGYKAMPLLMGASGNRQDEAQAFLKSRAACGSDTACLTSLYNDRISTLQKNIDWAVKNYCNTQ